MEDKFKEYIDRGTLDTDLYVIFQSLLPQLHQLADKQLELDRGDRLLGELRLLLPFRPRRGASLLPPCHLPALHNRHLRSQPQDCSTNDCEMWSYEILNFYIFIYVHKNVLKK